MVYKTQCFAKGGGSERQTLC